MECELCIAINENWRLIKKTQHSFAVICLDPIKKGHIIVLPKKHIKQEEIEKLNSKEIKDFITLVQEMEDLINKRYEENAITFKNSKKHSSQEHLHYHILPSKGSLRELFSNLEKTPLREEIEKEKYIQIRDEIISS